MNIGDLTASLSVMWKGMTGIFTVMILIMGFVYLINKIQKK